jgi:hypothetical protein
MADETRLENVPDPNPRQDPDPLADQVTSAVLEDEEGDSYVVDQQNRGSAPDTRGEGEYPSPSEAEPEAPAPGAAGPPE